MANVNKIKAQGTIYDIEDTVARTSAVTITSKADGTVELTSPTSTVTVPSITNFGDPSELENDVVTEISDLKSEISSMEGQGISVGAVNQLISILQHGLYDADQTSAILQLRALLLENVPATITYALTGVTSSNSSTSVTTGRPFTTTLTPTDPTHTITNVSVVMSDLDVTSSVYNSATGEISIDAVSGNVVITAEASYVAIIYNWDFTNSLTDTLQNKTAVIKSGVTQSEAGIQFTATKQYVALHSSLEMTGKTIEIDVSDSSDFAGTGAHGRLVAFSTSSSYNTDSAAAGLVWNYSPQRKWMFYKGSAWDSNGLAGANYFKGKTIRIYIPSTKIPTVSVAPIGSRNFETVLTSAGAITYTKGVVMGSSGTDNLVGMIITGVRIYEGDIS